MLDGKASLVLIIIQELLSLTIKLNLKPQLKAILDTTSPKDQKGGYTEHLDQYFLMCERQG